MEEQNFMPQKPVIFLAKKRELIFFLSILITGCCLCNCLFYAGANLGFAVFTALIVLCSFLYLHCSGCRLTPYSAILLICSLAIIASFPRGDDWLVKFILTCFLIVSVNLSFSLMAGQNRRSAAGIGSLLDVPRNVFTFGMGKLPSSVKGLYHGVRQSGSAGKKSTAILLGLVIAVPLLAVVIPLLIRADAAFDALLQKLPSVSFSEIFGSFFTGVMLAVFLYSRGAGLRHAEKSTSASKTRKGVNPLTINTVLIAIGIVYLVYLISQLAYFSGGFSGILPEGYTLAEYARRGFFEMAWLCAINLGIMAFAVGLVRKEASAPLLTKLICLFLGIVTLFLVVSASAKMFMYIDSFGLTRLRVLTEVIMVWLGLAALTVSAWLFLPKLPYMKVILVTALIIGAIVSWADVDTVVARYNVNAYQSGKLDTVDVEYLNLLGNGAIPYVAQLTEAADPEVANAAKNGITWYYGEDYYRTEPKITEDIRGWNYVNHIAEQYIIFLEK